MLPLRRYGQNIMPIPMDAKFGIQKLSQWISGEGWEHIIGGHVDPSEQISEFEKL